MSGQSQVQEGCSRFEPVPAWTDEQPMRCTVCGETFVGRELGYMPVMCERDRCPDPPGRPDPVVVVPRSVAEALADALEQALEAGGPIAAPHRALAEFRARCPREFGTGCDTGAHGPRKETP
jgi:hypothetical protein